MCIFYQKKKSTRCAQGHIDNDEMGEFHYHDGVNRIHNKKEGGVGKAWTGKKRGHLTGTPDSKEFFILQKNSMKP